MFVRRAPFLLTQGAGTGLRVHCKACKNVDVTEQCPAQERCKQRITDNYLNEVVGRIMH